MRYQWRLVTGAIIALACLLAVCLGYDGAIKGTLGVIIGYLFGSAPKELERTESRSPAVKRHTGRPGAL